MAGKGFDGGVGAGEDGVLAGDGQLPVEGQGFCVPGGQGVADADGQGGGDGVEPVIGGGEGGAERAEGFAGEVLDVAAVPEGGADDGELACVLPAQQQPFEQGLRRRCRIASGTGTETPVALRIAWCLRMQDVQDDAVDAGCRCRRG